MALTVVTTTMGSHRTGKWLRIQACCEELVLEAFSGPLTDLQESYKHDKKQELGLSCHIPAPGVVPGAQKRQEAEKPWTRLLPSTGGPGVSSSVTPLVGRPSAPSRAPAFQA